MVPGTTEVSLSRQRLKADCLNDRLKIGSKVTSNDRVFHPLRRKLDIFSWKYESVRLSFCVHFMVQSVANFLPAWIYRSLTPLLVLRFPLDKVQKKHHCISTPNAAHNARVLGQFIDDERVTRPVHMLYQLLSRRDCAGVGSSHPTSNSGVVTHALPLNGTCSYGNKRQDLTHTYAQNSFTLSVPHRTHTHTPLSTLERE